MKKQKGKEKKAEESKSSIPKWYMIDYEMPGSEVLKVNDYQ
jgi:hypothetical protein